MMATNEYIVTNRSADDRTLCCGRRSAEYFGAVDSRWLFANTLLAIASRIEATNKVFDICARILFLLIIFSVRMTLSARGVTSMIQKRLDKLREI